MTLQSSCQVLTSSKHAPISCLGKDSPTLNLLITHIFKCSAASWHSPCQSGPGPLTQPCDYLSYLVVFCQCRDPPLPFFRYSCQCQLPWASLEQGGESLGGNCALKKCPWKQRLSLPSPPDCGSEVSGPQKVILGLLGRFTEVIQFLNPSLAILAVLLGGFDRLLLPHFLSKPYLPVKLVL